jgi:hypothetical protein
MESIPQNNNKFAIARYRGGSARRYLYPLPPFDSRKEAEYYMLHGLEIAPCYLTTDKTEVVELDRHNIYAMVAN